MTKKVRPATNRRQFIQHSSWSGIALASVAVAAARERAAVSKSELPRVNDPRESLRLFVKTSGDLSGAAFSRSYAGQLFAVEPGSQTRPLLSVEGFGLGWTRLQADGSCHQAWRELLIFKDSATDEILDQWRNPYTDEICEVSHIHNRSVNLHLKATGEPSGAIGYSFDDARPKAVNLPWVRQGDRMVVSLDTRSVIDSPLSPIQWRRESSGLRVSLTEFASHSALLADLTSSKLTSAPSVGTTTRLSPWLPWMMMGPVPGQVILRCQTRKAPGMAAIAPQLREFAARRFPDFLQVPSEADYALPTETSWSVFSRERKPWAAARAPA